MVHPLLGERVGVRGTETAENQDSINAFGAPTQNAEDSHLFFNEIASCRLYYFGLGGIWIAHGMGDWFPLASTA